jgi:hypothetical protein
VGHASLKTTTIYAKVVGRKELTIADLMWMMQTEDGAQMPDQ